MFKGFQILFSGIISSGNEKMKVTKKPLPIARQAENGGFNEIKVIILDLYYIQF